MEGKRNKARRLFREGYVKESFRIVKDWKDLFGEGVKHIQRAYEMMVGNSIYKEMGYDLGVEMRLAIILFTDKLLVEKKK